MPDHGQPEVVDPRVGHGRRERAFDPLRPDGALAAPAEAPAQDVGEGARLDAARIEEARSVEMVARWAVVIAVAGHRGPRACDRGGRRGAQPQELKDLSSVHRGQDEARPAVQQGHRGRRWGRSRERVEAIDRRRVVMPLYGEDQAGGHGPASSGWGEASLRISDDHLFGWEVDGGIRRFLMG